jgi:hypothetical protein
MIDCTDDQLMEEVRRRGFVIRDAQVGAKWVGLTDEEKEQATGWSVEHIEAKIKEKNVPQP